MLAWRPSGTHHRAQSRSDSEWEKIRYHFYHFKGQLPLVTAAKCASLRVSANAVLFYNAGCRHPLRHALRWRVSGLRNRRLEVRILWGVLTYDKTAPPHVQGHVQRSRFAFPNWPNSWRRGQNFPKPLAKQFSPCSRRRVQLERLASLVAFKIDPQSACGLATPQFSASLLTTTDDSFIRGTVGQIAWESQG